MKRASSMPTLTLLLTLSILAGCSSSDDDDSAPEPMNPADQPPVVLPSGNDDPEVNNFPDISILWPSQFNISTFDLDADATGPQLFVFATVPLDGQAGNRIVCAANYSFTNITTAEETYNAYIAGSTSVNVLSVEDKTQDGRTGKEIYYDLVNTSNVAVSGLATAYYFNADADQLTRNALFTLDCGATTSTFQDDRGVILQVQNSVKFSPRSKSALPLQSGATLYRSTEQTGMTAPVSNDAATLGSFSH